MSELKNEHVQVVEREQHRKWKNKTLVEAFWSFSSKAFLENVEELKSFLNFINPFENNEHFN